MKIQTTIHREIEIPVTLLVVTDYDDDGCGPPSSTGNSMTGRRGKAFHYIEDYEIDTSELEAAVRRSIKTDDTDLLEEVAIALEDNEDDYE